MDEPFSHTLDGKKILKALEISKENAAAARAALLSTVGSSKAASDGKKRNLAGAQGGGSVDAAEWAVGDFVEMRPADPSDAGDMASTSSSESSDNDAYHLRGDALVIEQVRPARLPLECTLFFAPGSLNINVGLYGADIAAEERERGVPRPDGRTKLLVAAGEARNREGGGLGILPNGGGASRKASSPLP